MTLHKQRMHTDRGGGFGELEGAVGSASGLFAGAWELGGVGDIEADGWGALVGEGGAVEFHHVGDADEVVDEAVVAEECAPFGEHEVFAPGFGGFADRSDHFGWREELAFFDVKCSVVCFACPGRGDDEVGLSAEECRDLDQIDDGGDRVGLFGGVDVGGDGDAELLFDGCEMLKPLLDPDASFRGDRRAVGLVEAGFEDVGEPERFAHGFAVLAHNESEFERFERARPGDDGEGLIWGYGMVGDGAGSVHIQG